MAKSGQRPPVSIPPLSQKDIRRFWNRVDIQPGECWPFMGTPNEDGYCVFVIPYWLDGKRFRKTYYAHRVSYRIRHGDPGEMTVHHKCEFGMCCNPEHLQLRTNAANVAMRNLSAPPQGNALPLSDRQIPAGTPVYHCNRCHQPTVVAGSSLVPPSPRTRTFCFHCGETNGEITEIGEDS